MVVAIIETCYSNMTFYFPFCYFENSCNERLQEYTCCLNVFCCNIWNSQHFDFLIFDAVKFDSRVPQIQFFLTFFIFVCCLFFISHCLLHSSVVIDSLVPMSTSSNVLISLLLKCSEHTSSTAKR